MSLNFKVQKVEEYQGVPDGTYKAQVQNVDYVQSNFGNYYIVNWEIMEPEVFAGKIHKERYKIEHEKEDVRNIHINNFSKFCMEIGGLKEGDDAEEKHFLYKAANIRIQTKPGKNDGRNYTKIASMKLYKPTAVNKTAEPSTVMYEGILVPNPAAPGFQMPLNDEVPF